MPSTDQTVKRLALLVVSVRHHAAKNRMAVNRDVLFPSPLLAPKEWGWPHVGLADSDYKANDRKTTGRGSV
jgi:hypothetical protein